MTKSIKRGISLFLALVFVLTLLPAAALATEEPAPKFQVIVSSDLGEGKEPTKVVGTVDPNYQATLVIPNKEVSASNMTVAVSMTDVASLGIEGTRSYSKTLNTGVDLTMNLFAALAIAAQKAELPTGVEAVKDFTATTINASITSGDVTRSVTYNVNGEAFSEADGKVITATANEDAARAAWQLMTAGNIKAGTKTEDDSYFNIVNGSWLQIGNEKLVFEKDGDLKLDKLGDPALLQTIKDQVKVVETKSSALRFHLAAGTELAMSQSSAKLTKDLDVEVTGFDQPIPEGILSGLRTAVNNTTDSRNLLVMLMLALEKAVYLVDGQELNVNMTFSTPKTPKFEITASSKLNDGSVTTVTGSVFGDYSAKLVLPNAPINAGNVTITAAMNDVDSLGGGNKSHSITLNTEMGAEVDLPTALNLAVNLLKQNGMLDESATEALFDFDEATVTANIVRNHADPVSVKYTLEGSAFDPATSDEKVIAATVNEGEARAAWHYMVNDANFDITAQDTDDSYINIANGSWLQVGMEVLKFEEGKTGDIKLDNFAGMNADTIKDIQDMVTVEDVRSNALAFELKAGTALAVGQSIATLKNDVIVNVSGLNVPQGVLSQLRTAVNSGTMDQRTMVLVLIGLMEKAVSEINHRDLVVNIEFVAPYTVSFVTGVEQTIDAQEVMPGELAEEPEALVRPGYNFAGWQLDKNTMFNFETMEVTRDITLTAVWTPITYTVVLDGVDEVEFTYGVEQKLTPAEDKDGWTFQGWENEDGTIFVPAGEDALNLTTEDGAVIVLMPVYGDHVHAYKVAEWIWSDDYKTASVVMTCDLCGEDEEGHEVTADVTASSEIVKDATCVETGLIRYTAVAFGWLKSVREVEIPLADHTPRDMIAVAATCLTSGHHGGVECAVCGEVLEAPAVDAALGHTYTSTVTTQPTTTAEGVRTYICSRCGHTYTEAIDRLPGGGGGSTGGGSTGGTTINDNDVPLAGVLPFDDVTENDWFYDAVKYVYDNELMSGTDVNAFSPYMDTTRGMIVTLLYNLEGKPAVTGTAKFTDVDADQYYYNAVIWGTENKVIAGYDETTYGPNDIITREQFAAILYRYAAYKNYDVKTAEGAALDFTDADKVSEYAEANLLWAVEKALINGMGDGTVNPTGHANRAQAATILMNFCEKIAK